MPNIRVVISDPKTGKSVQKELKEGATKKLMSMTVGQSVKGEAIDFDGYEFKITGGSDIAGFPMRADYRGSGRKKIFAVSGIGLSKTDSGIKQRKTIAGNTIYPGIAQVNLKIIKAGAENLFPVKVEEKKE